jgi:integrase
VFTLTPVTLTTTLRTAADLYLDSLKLDADLRADQDPARDAHGTWRARRYGLSLLGDFGQVQLGQLQRSAIARWVKSLSRLKSQRTGRRLASADRNGRVSLGALIGWCVEQNDELVALPTLLRNISWDYRPPPGRALTWDELETLKDELAARDVPAWGSREGRTYRVSIRILRVIFNDAARAFEVRTARVQQFCPVRGTITWPEGKNRKPRTVVLSPVSLAICADQAKVARSLRTDYLFASPVSRRPITHPPLNRLLKRIARAAGVSEAGVRGSLSTHVPRYTVATLAKEAADEDGRPLFSVQDIADLLGNDPETCESVYIRAVASPGARRVNAYVNPSPGRRGGHPNRLVGKEVPHGSA